MLQIRNLQIDIPLALAPMVGLSHSALRTLLVEHGGIGLLYTEMLAASRLPQENPLSSPLLVRGENEFPLIYQIFLATEQPVEAAVRKLEILGADGVDLNLGCPAPQLRRRGAGGFLAEDRQLVQKIIARIRNTTELPVSAKIRLGRSLDREKLIDFCTMLEGEGIDMLTVHGRLHSEKFCRTPRWDWIGIVKENVSLPVFANGGIFSVEDARKCIDQSGADGLMIGRGGIERPWLFADIARELYGCKNIQKMPTIDGVYFRFVELLEEKFRVERRLGRLKQFTSYFAANFTFGHHLASMIQTSKTMEEATHRAEEFFNKTTAEELCY